MWACGCLNHATCSDRIITYSTPQRVSCPSNKWRHCHSSLRDTTFFSSSSSSSLSSGSLPSLSLSLLLFNILRRPASWSIGLTTNHEVPGSIPGATVRIFLEGEDSRGDHGLGRLVEFRFKAPPGTTSPSITTHAPSGQLNRASWASQPQKSVTLLSRPSGRTTKSTKDTWRHWRKKIFLGWGHSG